MAAAALTPQQNLDAFFSDFYLRAYAGGGDEEEARAEALDAARLAGCALGAAVLDVACGFARHAVPLAAAGYRVTGVDRSEALLAEGRRRAAEAASELALVAADYRELPFPDASFDGALNLFSSLGYLGDEEDVKVLAEVARVLRPGGRLVIDTMHRDQVVRDEAVQPWERVGAGRLLLEQRAFDAATGVLQTTQTLIEGSGERDSRVFSIRVYAATELVTMLHRAGFSEVRCAGGFAHEPLTPTSRLVIAATR